MDWFADADTFLLGRVSYGLLAAHGPKITDPGDPVAAKLNTLPKYVPASTATDLTWTDSHRLSGDLAEEVSSLKRQPGRALQVHGSGKLIQALLRHDLVDELRLLTFPVVLGKGKRLFELGTIPSAWRLTDVQSTPAGVIAQTYQRAGSLQLGAVVAGTDGTEELVTIAS